MLISVCHPYREEESKASHWQWPFSLSLARRRKYILLLYTHLYINQKMCQRSLAVFLLLRVLAKFGLDAAVPPYKNRVCI